MLKSPLTSILKLIQMYPILYSRVDKRSNFQQGIYDSVFVLLIVGTFYCCFIQKGVFSCKNYEL